MSLIIPPGFALITWRFSCDGDSEEMLSTCGVSDEGTANELAQLASDSFTDAFAENMISQSYTFLGCRSAVGQDGGPPDTGEYDTLWVGSADPTRYAPNTAILLKKTTGVGGRANRGRMFLPPIWHEMGGSNVSAAGVMGLDVVGEIQTAVDTWFGPLEPVILHDDSSPVSVPTPITAITVQARLASQRRRLRP